MVTTIRRGDDKKVIEERLKLIYKNLNSGFDARKFCGIIKINDNPKSIQKRLRDEWK